MKKIIIGIFTFFLLMGVLHFRTYNTFSNNKTEYKFQVEKGDNFVSVGRKLADNGLIANRVYFYYYILKNNLRDALREGNYLIEPHSDIAGIVYKITSKDNALVHVKENVKITFPEGWTAKQMADRINKNNLPGDIFLNKALNPTNDIYDKFDFLSRGNSLEGYLFPDTYFFDKDATAQDIITKMLNNFEKKINTDKKLVEAKNNGRLREVVIFASIIEGEVSNKNDRYLVAGIFKNRLDIGMPLQSDATIDYIKGISEIKHTQQDIGIDSPYNTYKYTGLPPGPINNPSLESLQAAVSPQDTDYMYFLNNPQTGETVFSKTLDEHNINKYHNGL